MSRHQRSSGKLRLTSSRVEEAKIGPQAAVAFAHDRHVDSMASEVHGKKLFHYEYDVFRFSDEQRTLVARSYAHEPDRADFLSIEANDGAIDHITEATFRTDLFRVAARHLQTMGKKQLYWLDAEAQNEPYALIPERFVDAP